MNYFKQPQATEIIREALREDIGKKDITTSLIIPKNKYARGVLLAKEECIICGIGIVAFVFKVQDRNIKFKPLVADGQKIKRGEVIARLFGKAQSILTAERVALNFLSFLSGIATKTREYVEAVKPYKVKIMDTRKTIPAFRELEKYAVRIGGGFNHRFSLDEMVLIKDNHIKILGSGFWVLGMEERIKRIKKDFPKIKIEIEVKNLKEFKETLRLNPDIIMLDNMKITDIKKAVKVKKSLLPELEASGGITIKNIKEIASTGVDLISIGALTHSVQAIDISLEIL